MAGSSSGICQKPKFTIEVDEMDFGRCLEIQRPYLGPVAGYYTDWTALKGRGVLFPEDVDTSDPQPE
jgi:homospermidine synthase